MSVSRALVRSTPVMVLGLATFVPSVSARRGAEPPLSGAQVERVAALADLYGAVAYFHPQVASSAPLRAAWDSVFAAGAEGAARSRNGAEYRSAVEGMVRWIGDPGTRVEKSPSVAPRWTSRRLDDGTLVVGVAIDGGGRVPSELHAAVASATKVVFDLRAPGLDPREVGAAFDAAGFTPWLADRPLRAPRQRTRSYTGHPREPESGQSAFAVRWRTVELPSLVQRTGVANKRVAFILPPGATVPAAALALQREGLGILAAEGPLSDGAAARTYRVALPGGIVVAVRTAEVVDATAAAGIRPDTTIAAGAGPDEALRSVTTLVSGRGMAVAETPVDSATIPATSPVAAGANRPRPAAYPSLGLRIVSAVRLWNVVRHFYPYKHQLDRPWDRVLRDMIPVLAAARDSAEYVAVVARMSTHLHDSHTQLSGAGARAFWGSSVPARLRMIEGQPVVVGFDHDSASRLTGLRTGDVVLSVDGERSRDRVARLGRYIASSTPQGATSGIMSRFLDGASDSATLVVQGDDGRQRRLTAKRARRSPSTAPERSGPVWRIVGDDVGYVDLDRLERAQIDTMLAALRDTRGIIFDMRGYPRGVAWSLAPRLNVHDTVVTGALFTRMVVSSPDTSHRDSLHYRLPVASRAPRYTRPTVMLIDERAISEAEHTGLYLRATSGTRFVGTPTQGANGDISFISLPGSLSVVFTGASFRWPDGSALQRRGLQPDIRVAPTIAGIRAGRDEVLERAIRYLKETAR